MIEDKDIANSRKIIQDLIKNNWIVSSDDSFVNFFLTKSETSLQTAQALLGISQTGKLKQELNLPSEYDAYMWVVNSAYYSMFYAATSLLAKYNHRIKIKQGTHSLTYHALVYYFLDSGKLARHILEQYKKAEQEVSELLQVSELEARKHLESVKFELYKRQEFTYYMGKVAERSKAVTSISRAKEFLTLAKELISSHRN
ncbi:MAG: hypothetical protein ABIB71_00820 [Candidatus Woesearchaeota archaeon]